MTSLLPVCAAILFAAAPRGSPDKKELPCPRQYEVQKLGLLKLQFRGPRVKDTQEIEGDVVCSLESPTMEALSVSKWRKNDPATLEDAVDKEAMAGGKTLSKAALPDGWKLTVWLKEADKEFWDVQVRRTLGTQVWKCAGRAVSLEGAEDLEKACLSLSLLGTKLAPNPKMPKGCARKPSVPNNRPAEPKPEP